MFQHATPEQCGISSKTIEKYIRRLDENGYAMHSILMSRGNKIFTEGYWKPFSSESHQRMNSVTKSFVGIAIGLLVEEGKLSLSDKASMFFDEICMDDIAEDTKDLTIDNLLSMRTLCADPKGHWVRDKKDDRIGAFFSEKPAKYSDTLFRYDSNASYILCVIVEKLTGMTFVDYLKQKLMDPIGFSSNTDCIKCPDGYSWGDSGLLCRSVDLLKFAKLIMDKGVYNGKRLMNEAFITQATSKISDTNLMGFDAHNTFGYGYQIWKTYEDGFAFFGMGDQLVICIPKKEFIFVCTADNQGNPGSRPVIMNLLYYDIIKELSDEPLCENTSDYNSLCNYLDNLELVSLKGNPTSSAVDTINDTEYILNPNPMNIEKILLHFNDDLSGGYLFYKNQQGEKKLDFSLCKNIYTVFPEEGYPDMKMNVPCPGNKYPCAVSAAWLEERKFAVRVQMTGKHLGGLYICLGYSDDYKKLSVIMTKNTNCFLNEYQGHATAYTNTEECKHADFIHK